jgi:hypothetical protein
VDFSKYPLEKLFYFVAGIIPGSAALVILGVSEPGRYNWFFDNWSLGYRTKFALILVLALIIGNSLTVFLTRILGAIAGAIGGSKGDKLLQPLRSELSTPWRSAKWRELVKKELGDRAPTEVPFVSEWLFEQRRKLIESLPPAQQTQPALDLGAEKLKSDINDSEWEQWYDHYHQVVIWPPERPFEWHVQNGFNFNLQAASLYILISALVVPSVRHWWCILPASVWVLFLLAEMLFMWNRYTNRWSTFTEQIKLLSQNSRSTVVRRNQGKQAAP